MLLFLKIMAGVCALLTLVSLVLFFVFDFQWVHLVNSSGFCILTWTFVLNYKNEQITQRTKNIRNRRKEF